MPNREPNQLDAEALHREGLLTDSEYEEIRRRAIARTPPWWKRISRKGVLIALLIIGVLAVISGVPLRMIVNTLGGNETDEYVRTLNASQSRIARAGEELMQDYFSFSNCVFSEECDEESFISAGDSLANKIVPYLSILDREIQALDEIQAPEQQKEIHMLFLRMMGIRRDGFALLRSGWLAQNFEQMAEGESKILQASGMVGELVNLMNLQDERVSGNNLFRMLTILANVNSAASDLSPLYARLSLCSNMVECDKATNDTIDLLKEFLLTIDRAISSLNDLEIDEDYSEIYSIALQVLELERSGWDLNLQGLESGDSALITQGDQLLAEATNLRASLVDETQALRR